MLEISFKITIIRVVEIISYTHSNFNEIVIGLLGDFSQFISDEVIVNQFWN